MHPATFLPVDPLALVVGASSGVLAGLGACAVASVRDGFLGQFWTRARRAPLLVCLVLLADVRALLGSAAVAGSALLLLWSSRAFPELSATGVVPALTTGALVGWAWAASRRSANRPPALPPPPSLATGDGLIDGGFASVWEFLKLNLQAPPGRKGGARWASPAPKYPGAYLWDSAFISLAWKLWDPRVGREVLGHFWRKQSAGGMCPQLLFLGRWPAKISNPPLLAWALRELLPWLPPDDPLFSSLTAVVSKLKKFRAWFFRERRAGELFAWAHSYESGLDNSPRFTDASERVKEDVADLQAVDLTSYLVLQARSLGDLARAVGDEEEGSRLEGEADHLAKVARRLLWEPSVGRFADRRASTGKVSGPHTLASTLPLVAGIADERQRESVVAHLLDPAKFATRIPFPSVARDDPSFSKDAWRGPVWVNLAYLALKALSAAGVGVEAADLALRLAVGVYQTWRREGSFYEFYDPDGPGLGELHRKKDNWWKRATLGDKPVGDFVGWTGLVNLALVEFVVGYNRVGAGRVELRPHLPAEWRERQLSLRLPFFGEEWSFELDANEEVHYELRQPGGKLLAVGRVPNHGAATVEIVQVPPPAGRG